MRVPGILLAAIPVVWALTVALRAVAGDQPPIHGVTGTIALPATVDKFYSDMNKLVVKTSDGVERVVTVTKGTKVHGGTSLDGLTPGTPVVVHYTVKGINASAVEIDRLGPDGLKQNEGTVGSVDRKHKRITVRFANGTTETLRLTKNAADGSDRHTKRGSRVIVYYRDEAGQRVAHYFKPVH
jgi:hypothetical protein